MGGGGSYDCERAFNERLVMIADTQCKFLEGGYFRLVGGSGTYRPDPEKGHKFKSPLTSVRGVPPAQHGHATAQRTCSAADGARTLLGVAVAV